MIVSVEVPQEIYDRASAIARSQSMTIGEVFATACTEHVAAWDRLEKRAAQGDRAKFIAVLAKVPDVDPDERDRL